jgi:hypothetical protein
VGEAAETEWEANPVTQVSHQFTSSQPLDEVHRHLFHNVSPFLAGWGYNLRAQDERSFTYSREYRPTWVILVCIFLFPLGLLSLLAGKQSDALLVSLASDGELDTRVMFSGEVPDGLRDAILKLPEP